MSANSLRSLTVAYNNILIKRQIVYFNQVNVRHVRLLSMSV